MHFHIEEKTVAKFYLKSILRSWSGPWWIDVKKSFDFAGELFLDI